MKNKDKKTPPMFEQNTFPQPRAPITNTREEMFRDPKGFLFEAMLTGTSNTIERMERRGQQELTSQKGSKVHLPRKGSEDPAFAKMGIKFGNVVPGDDLFIEAELPKGWTLKATSHSMWNELLDERGRKRAGIFHKAAFYDRAAHMHPERRFQLTAEWQGDSHDAPRREQVKDAATGAVVFQTEWLKSFDRQNGTDADRTAYYAQQDLNEKACRSWLSSKYPDWQDAAAYW